MAGEHLDREDLALRVPDDATPAQCVATWVDLMNACEQFLLAGLRREIGPQGDLRAAYRQWYAQQMEEHDRMIRQLARRLSGGGSDR